MSLAYLSRIDGELIREHGLDAAALHALILWRTKKRPDGWVATRADIFDDIGLTRRRLEVAREVLREAGLLIWEASGGRQYRWKITSGEGSDETRQRPDVTGPSSYRENPEELLPPAATASEPPEEESMDTPEPADFQLISEDDIPAPVPPKNGATLVARWVEGHRSTGEADPPGPLMKRVAGQCGRLAKDCVTDEDWRAAWLACYRAGELGRVDPVPLMVKARSQFEQRPRFNENTHLKMLRDGSVYDDLPPSPMDVLRGITQ